MTLELTMVALGDSLTEAGKVGKPFYANMIRDHIEDKHHGRIRCRVLNAGRAGGTSAGVEPVTTDVDMAWIRDEVISQSPQLVLILLGLNDIRHSLLSEADYVRNMREIISVIRAETGAHVVLGDIAHMTNYQDHGPVWNHGSREKTLRFCSRLHRLGEELGLAVARVHAAMDYDDSLLRDDGIHPNDDGQRRIADAFWAVMKDYDYEALARQTCDRA